MGKDEASITAKPSPTQQKTPVIRAFLPSLSISHFLYLIPEINMVKKRNQTLW
jgi:hypothetical protein